MPATIQIVNREFTNESGSTIPYKRVEISGYINGERVAVELGATRPDLTILGMILNSTEEAPTTTVTSGGEVSTDRKSSEDALDDFLNN
jgi:hypothetical protein